MKRLFGVLILCTAAAGLPGAAAAGVSAAETAPASVALPAPDPGLQRDLENVVALKPFKKLVGRGDLSVVLIDVTDTSKVRWAGVAPDEMRYAASLPKIAVLLAVFDKVEAGRIEYTPQLKASLEMMIRKSSNRAASEMIKLVGFESIARTLRDPRFELYDPNRQGGLWVGKDYGGTVGRWKRDPLHHISHGATARQVARFLLMMDEGRLISPWASREMKDILSHPAIHHKFVKGLESSRPGSDIYRKSGTWREWHADAALVERDGRKYIAVALLRSKTKGVLAKLIVQLDDLIHRPAGVPPALAEAKAAAR